jgi:hypothetical protein
VIVSVLLIRMLARDKQVTTAAVFLMFMFVFLGLRIAWFTTRLIGTIFVFTASSMLIFRYSAVCIEYLHALWIRCFVHSQPFRSVTCFVLSLDVSLLVVFCFRFSFFLFSFFFFFFFFFFSPFSKDLYFILERYRLFCFSGLNRLIGPFWMTRSFRSYL